MEQQEQSQMLAVDTVAPNFRLASAQGHDIALEDYRGQRNVLLWFSKGLFCPFCRRYMAQLRLGYQELQARNTDILQITWSTPEEAQLYFRQYQLSFPYLCDPERAVSPQYGIRLSRAAIGKFVAGMGTSMVAMVSGRLLHGEKSPSPVPHLKRYGTVDMEQQAVFLIDKAGIIRYVHATGPLGGLPSSAEYVRQLDRLQ
ncbi:MAG: peroxiredoxin family protein [Deltaproteobacteria bacterium]|nr:peroxiredoxin family protein [Deltaproteobacteria bacterium]